MGFDTRHIVNRCLVEYEGRMKRYSEWESIVYLRLGLSLLQVCEKVHTEAALVPFARDEVFFSSIPILATFPESCPNERH